MKKNLYIIAGWLATKSYKNTISRAKAVGYNVTLLFFWLQTASLAKERVKKRVAEGGHNIDEPVIERRYLAGIRNLFDIYFPIADAVLVFDNSEGKHELIAKKHFNFDLYIIDNDKFNKLKNYYDSTR